jgi:anti-anti-sigma factor
MGSSAELGVLAQNCSGGKAMEIKTESMRRCELVTVTGRIDSSTARDLEKALLGLVQTGQKNIVVNLTDTTFISSAGLKAILSAQMKVRKMIPSGDVVISGISSQVKESFDLVGFDRLFKFYDEDIKAVGSF